MLGLPLTSVLFTAIFLTADAVALTPLVIVAVVVAYVASARLGPLESLRRMLGRPSGRPSRASNPPKEAVKPGTD